MSKFHGRKLQRGMIALALALLLISASSLYAVSNARRDTLGARSNVTRAALEQARRALLGYAAAYPDRVNAEFGPGYLPCPAQTERGISGPACSASSGSTLGRFPWHTLRTIEIRDGAGENLWYAVSPSHRYNPKLEPLNSDTVASMDVDGDAVVAVVIAPGAPFIDQVQRRGSPMDAGQYLEGRNGDADVTGFTRSGSDGQAFNDQITTITRRDLLDAIEPRVLGEVEKRMSAFAAAHGRRYPWLGPRAQRDTEPQGGVGDGRAGFLLFHYADDRVPSADAKPFSSDLELAWRLEAAVVSHDDPDGVIPPACLLSSPCVTGSTPAVEIKLAGPARCDWWSPSPLRARREVARCTFVHTEVLGDRRVHYRVTFAIDDDDEIEITDPDRERPRTRRIVTTRVGELDGDAGLHITIAIQATREDGAAAIALISAGRATQGFFSASGIRYALDIERGELPAWFVRNAWHEQIYLAWAETDCDLVDSCLTVRTMRRARLPVIHNGVRALAISAGPALRGALPRIPGAPLSAWFEQEHRNIAGIDAAYLAAPVDAGFNDRLRIIEARP